MFLNKTMSIRQSVIKNSSQIGLKYQSIRRAHTMPNGMPEYIGDPRTRKEIATAQSQQLSKMSPVMRLVSKFRQMLGPDRSKANLLTLDDTARFKGPMFRFDTRSPKEILAAKGFTPRGKKFDFEPHQKGGANLQESGLVSFSKDESGVEQVRQKTGHSGKHGFVYKAKGHPNDTFDLSMGLAMDHTFEDQREVAVAGPVDLDRIESVTDTRTGKTMPFPPLD